MSAPLLYSNVTPMRGEAAAQWFITTFAVNGWSGAWRGPIDEAPHYHLNSHKVLGIFEGEADLQFGGPGGQVLRVRAGDVVVIAAGLAHAMIAASDPFEAIGATPGGLRPDLHYGGGAPAPAPLRPRADPVLGPGRGFVA
ncbi:cupin domain-containing protein [Paracoccus aminophilus]|uniref:Cupin type-1 domain-containing protein n=1 Tax=Paracoccus aminophilus JCM 7686 TaxID=1367847 RepID=S5YUT2_PARAH|nr:cupin domain-containing protein [Paracoccus aminophilus]AGT08971.1 hypothetical protein JCM7686_1870 [Paracoccus aminophilus JCM 7686]